MPTVMQYDFRLFGPRKGQTIVINGHPFVEGHAVIVQSSENMGFCIKVLSAYAAHPRGTPAYDEAVALEEVENGPDKVSDVAIEREDGSDQTGLQPDGGGPAEGGATAGGADVDPTGADGSGGGPSGDGHQDTRVPKFPEDVDKRPVEPSSEVNGTVRRAVEALNPEVDDHWVATGAHKDKPRLSAVEDAYGKAGLSRQDIEVALPGYNRKAAVGAALAA